MPPSNQAKNKRKRDRKKATAASKREQPADVASAAGAESMSDRRRQAFPQLHGSEDSPNPSDRKRRRQKRAGDEVDRTPTLGLYSKNKSNVLKGDDYDLPEGVKVVSWEEMEEREKTFEEAKSWLSALKVEDVINPTLFAAGEAQKHRDVFRASSPFPYLSLKDFLDSSFAEQLTQELQGLPFYTRNNDLYKFVVSKDFRSIDADREPLIGKLREVLYSEQFRDFLYQVTGIHTHSLEDDNSVDMSAAVYSSTDTLLCHDDRFQGRRIAYIMYFVPEDWSEEDGGQLDLYDSDPANNHPRKVAKSLVPQWNTLTFFEVSAQSWHRVREVISADDKKRLSISGWFHGVKDGEDEKKEEKEKLQAAEDVQLAAAVREAYEANFVPISADGVKPQLEAWVSKEYLGMDTMGRIRRAFQEQSSIELQHFIRKDRYQAMLKELETAATLENQDDEDDLEFKRKKSHWDLIGPAHKREYFVLQKGSKSSSTPTLDAFAELIRSRTWALFMQELTGVVLTAVLPETRKFRTGCYSLASDDSPERFYTALDCFLTLGDTRFVNPSTWNEERNGGTLHYLALGKDEPLLSVQPSANTLALVYRYGGDILSFRKYVTHLARDTLYEVFAVYHVDESEMQDSGDDEGDEGDAEEEAPREDASSADEDELD